MIAAYLIEPGRPAYELEDLAAEYGVEAVPQPEVEEETATLIRAAEVPRRLAGPLRARLRERGSEELYDRIELPLTAVLASMEDVGIKIDTYRMGEITARLADRVEELESQAFGLAGEEFMLGSTQQLARILFEKLELTPGRKGKTGYSTDTRVLRSIRHDHAIVEVIEEIWKNREREYNVRCLVKRLQRIDKEMSGEARELFSVHIPSGDLREYAAALPQRLKEHFTDAMALLRDKAFQDLLMNYPRPSRVFLVAHETVDTVSSAWVVRGADGKDYRPEDYLVAFSRFVRENPEKVDAIGILLNRPRAWSTDALTELRRKLTVSPQRFTEENLRKAHQVCYHKALVDIISMVKHAANDQNPLLTAEERVARAFERVSKGKSFTSDQRQWLDRIKDHLVANLTIEMSDFDTLPVFTRSGGLTQATRAFAGRLEELIQQLNESIAA